MLNDTIAAIATAAQSSAIGIIRVSGENAISIASKVFRCKKDVSEISPRLATVGTVFDKNGEFDNVLLTIYKAPNSYTGEDMAEFSCHGSLAVLATLMDALIYEGARPAMPGEFTRRALINGKIDLIEAEAVGDLLAAKTADAARIANSGLTGVLSNEIERIRRLLLGIESHIAAYIDFPEEGVDEVTEGGVSIVLNQAKEKLLRLIETYPASAAIKDGVNTVIVGKTNVGKSSVMNLFSGYERSIVTEIPGTTRDVVDISVKCEDVLLNISDTAGIRDTEDKVESIGIARAKEKIADSELVIAVFDGSREISSIDIEILELCKGKKTVAVVNKTDLPQKIDVNMLKADCIVSICAKTGENFDNLKHCIATLVKNNVEIGKQEALILNLRQKNCIVGALEAVNNALEGAKNNITLDCISTDVLCAIKALSELSGRVANEDIIEEVFKNFCVGK